MTVEFIGFVGNYNASETIQATGKPLDTRYIRALAAAQEYGGFDRVLLAFHANSPESILVGQYILSVTERLKLMIAHRPGFTAPTVFARQIATLDHISGGGRVGIHIITGGVDAELAQDGDHLTKDERYARAAEYLRLVKQSWTSAEPFDHAGSYYTVNKGFADIRPLPPGIPIYFGGASQAALAVAGEHADVYALWGESYDQVREIVANVRAQAAPYGRVPRFSLSLRPIIADTEDAAWTKAATILERAKSIRAARAGDRGNNERARISRENGQPPNEGARRLLEAAKRGPRVDKRLWTELAAVTGALGNSTSLVGTPDQVADAMLDYYDLGISTFLIRGFDPIEDAHQYGRDLLPRVRALVADRPASTQTRRPAGALAAI